MSVPNSCDKIAIEIIIIIIIIIIKELKEEMFPSCLLNKSLKIKKEEKKATSFSAKVLLAS